MDVLREWIMQLAGVVVLGAICDIIMIEGEMKKYVKPILGFVLIFTVLKPIAGAQFDDFTILQSAQVEAGDLAETLEKTEKENLLSLYEKNVGEKISEYIMENYKVKAETAVVSAEDKDNFGKICEANINVLLSEGETANTESIRKSICEEFGIPKEMANISAVYGGR